MSELDKQLERLTPKQRELLLRRLQKQPGAAPPRARIERRPEPGPAPLSYAQERMWFLERLDPGQPAYNLFNGLRVRGALDVERLRRCLSEVVRRHEVLRSVFREEQGRLVQSVTGAAEIELPLDDLRSVPAERRGTELRRRATEEFRRPFDLARGPLVRARLVLLGPDDHVLYLTLHHIVADGWSFGVLVHEVAALYRAFAEGRPSPLRELPLQYADFAAWQRSWLAEHLDEQLAYWKPLVGGPLPQLTLPADNARERASGFRAGARSRLLSQALHADLLALARREGATLFMTLLAAFAVLLQRLGRARDFTVGCPIAGRNRGEIEGLVGCFLNTLVLRVDLAGDPPFREFLARVRETTLGAFAHQDVPLEALVQTLHGERAGRAPFQVMFLLQNFPTAELDFAGLTTSRVEADEGFELGDGVDLTLAVEERAEGLLLGMTYNAHLFEAESVEGWLEQYQVLLEGIVADPGRRLACATLLTDDGRRRLARWSDAGGTAEGDALVTHAFERAARRAPQAVAVEHAGRQLTYDALERAANRLARRLQALGLGPDSRAAVFLERSPELLIAVLAVLKAGGAYLPLDPALPAERAAFVLEDAGATLVLTRAGLQARLPACAARVLALDDADEARALARHADAALVDAPHPEQLAYVIYTSGSTGRPKGVMVPHAALAAYTETARRQYALTERDRVLQFASLSFDTHAEEIYPCLAAGATLVLRSDDMLASAREFLSRCAAWDVSVLDLPTAYWHELVERLREAPVPLPRALRLVILGGEQALPERLLAWQALAGESGAALVNTYGPTEATIVATSWRAPARDWPAARALPIGTPVRGACAHVLDERLEPLPAGIPGELYLGGVGLARGYLGRAALTAERFVPDPASRMPGARLYRTGDLARWRSDGTLEFLGRVDHQVKIRGFRVELGEIEQALLAQPDVAQAVAVAREDVPGERRIVAYVVLRRADDAALGALRDALAARLPDYMVPARLVRLERLPLTSSGKIDRAALPAPDPAAVAGGEYVAPATPVEERLAAIFARVLGLERVGVHDDFFRLGGHSLLLPQVLYQVQQAFDVQPPLRALVEGPTVAELALTVEELLLDQIEAPAGDGVASTED